MITNDCMKLMEYLQRAWKLSEWSILACIFARKIIAKDEIHDMVQRRAGTQCNAPVVRTTKTIARLIYNAVVDTMNHPVTIEIVETDTNMKLGRPTILR